MQVIRKMLLLPAEPPAAQDGFHAPGSIRKACLARPARIPRASRDAPRKEGHPFTGKLPGERLRVEGAVGGVHRVKARR